MLLIDDANAPPPVPLNHAATRRTLNGVSVRFIAAAVMIMGMANMIDVLNTTLRPPQIWVMKELGMRKVPPERPATAGKEYRSAL